MNKGLPFPTSLAAINVATGRQVLGGIWRQAIERELPLLGQVPFSLFPPSGGKCCSNNHIGPQVDLVAGGCRRLIIAPRDMSMTKSLNLWMLLYLEKCSVWMWLRIVWLSHHPGLSRWVWDAITSKVTKEKAEGDQIITHREGHVKTEQRMEWCSHKPRFSGNPQKLEAARKASPWGLQREDSSANTLMSDF